MADVTPLASEPGLPTVEIDGTVLEREIPVPFVALKVHAGGATISTMTDSAGHFRTLSGGSDLSFEVPGFDVLGQRQESGSEGRQQLHSLVIEVSGGASVSGRVLYEGQAVAGADVRVENGISVLSDPKGAYRVPVLAAGRHLLKATFEPKSATSRGLSINLEKGQKKTDLDLELDMSGSIAGTVVDERGGPVSGVRVVWACEACSYVGDTRTEADGTFRAAHLASGGSYRPQIRNPRGAPFSPLRGEKFPEVTMSRAVAIEGVILRIDTETTAIAGHLVNDDGQGIPGVTVLARAGEAPLLHGSDNAGVSSATTQGNGSFLLDGLPVGLYEVAVPGENGDRAVAEDVEAGRSDIVLVVRALVDVRGSLENFTRRPVEVAHAFRVARRIAFEFRSFDEKEFVWDHLATGDHWFLASDGTNMALERSSISTDDLVVTLHGRPARRILGTIDTAAAQAGSTCLWFLVLPGVGDAYVGTVSIGADGTFNFKAPQSTALRIRCGSSDRSGTLAIGPGELDATGQRIELSGP